MNYRCYVINSEGEGFRLLLLVAKQRDPLVAICLLLAVSGLELPNRSDEFPSCYILSLRMLDWGLVPPKHFFHMHPLDMLVHLNNVVLRKMIPRCPGHVRL